MYKSCESSELGRHLISSCYIPEGNLIFSERPLSFQRSLSNLPYSLSCFNCSSFIPQSNSFSSKSCVVPSKCKCGYTYCSEKCREAHWLDKGHCLLCTGDVSEQEEDSDPVVLYKVRQKFGFCLVCGCGVRC